jgi:dolichyl-phosphate beta-glucosyltransferase
LATAAAISHSKLLMDFVKYSIVIPAYNESERIVATLDKVLAYIAGESEFAGKTEVLVVNDGSRDNTAEIVKGYAAKYPAVRLIENPGNRGKGYSVRNGMTQAVGDIRLFSDADLSSPISEAPKLFAAIAAGNDVVIGSRWLDSRTQTERQSFFRQLIGRVFNLLLRIFLGVKEKDTQCGFKAFTARAADAIFPRQLIERWGFDPELIYLARRSGFKVAEVPVAWAHDTRSRLHPVRDGFKMGMDVLHVRWNALTGKYSGTLPNKPAERRAVV